MSETTSQLRAYNVRRDGCRWQPQPSPQQGEGEAQAVRRLRRQQRDHVPPLLSRQQGGRNTIQKRKFQVINFGLIFCPS